MDEFLYIPSLWSWGVLGGIAHGYHGNELASIRDPEGLFRLVVIEKTNDNRS
ncbi:hypothetical protein GW860_09940 [bacterium]|nr:hypothetical protein [bacterium]